MEERKVEIFDTTLRDGEQTPGLSFPLAKKLEIARKLDQLGVDVIEAGFPASSEKEMESVAEIVRAVDTPVCVLARIKERDLEPAFDSGAEIVHVFASTSEIQLKKSMKMSEDEVMEQSIEIVSNVKETGKTCIFSPMDASRTEEDYLLEISRAVKEAGVDMINIPDTVGVALPDQVKDMVTAVKKEVEIPLSVHCHDDYGLAVANSIGGVRGGADQIQVTINGLGERAGNASLEETVMNVERMDSVHTGINKEELFKASKLVERLSGIQLPPMKPVVGRNAFSHESGIHAAGMVEDKSTFEPELMDPETVGHRRRFIVGKHAGRQGLKKVLSEAGLEPTGPEVNQILKKVKSISSNGKKLSEADLYAIAETELDKPAEKELVELEQVFVMTGDNATPTATITAKVGGEEKTESGNGVGPIDAVFKAMKRIIGEKKQIEISEFRIDAITGGSDAVANVVIALEDERGTAAEARGTGDDIVIASVEALLNAVNLLARKDDAERARKKKIKNLKTEK
ncbi:2-isopropylmalate synthase [Candidatus Bipolaricaulota bacterium]|nr:2-isopropylmalate synthase [Candidatus Bipolaricaulota bacterium]